jgi:transposase
MALVDLRAFERRYSGLAERAYPPRMLLKPWLFAAISGLYGGREVARRLHYDLRFRYLAGELRPDFRAVLRETGSCGRTRRATRR